MTSSIASRAAAAAALTCPWLALAQPALEEVHVTGTPMRSSPNELAQSVSVLDGDTLARVESNNLGETLAGQVGISSSYFGTGASRPIIRGLGGPRVLTLEDGIATLDVSTVSGDHAVSVDPLVAEQIEIFRGPTTLLYGSGAVGGVVNTVTNRIPGLDAEDGIAGAFELRGDTAADERGGAVELDGGGERLAWHFDAQSRSTDDYAIPGYAEHAHEPGEDEHVEHGVLDNSSLEVDSAAVGASWLGDDAFVGVSVSRFESLYGVPGHAAHAHESGAPPAAGEAGHDDAVRIDLDRTRVDVEGGWLGLDGAIETVRMRVGVNDYAHAELEGGAVGTRFDNDAYEARVEVMHAPLGRWSGAFGVQTSERDFAAIGEEAFVPPVETRTSGLFAVERLRLEDWRVSIGGRLESQRHAPTGSAPDSDGSAVSASLAAIRELGGGLELALNAASAERLPAAEELYADGPHLATGTVELGDATLASERARHLDVGLRGGTDDRSWRVTAYRTAYDDFIYLRDTGTVDPAEMLPVFAFTQDDATLEGLEAELFTPLVAAGAGELDLKLQADVVRGELGDGTSLPRLPPASYGARLQYHVGRVVAGLGFTRYRRQDDTAPFEEPTAGYTLVDFDVTWRLDAGDALGVEVYVRGTNLNDEEARKHTSLVKDVAPLPGRNLKFGVRARF